MRSLSDHSDITNETRRKMSLDYEGEKIVAVILFKVESTTGIFFFFFLFNPQIYRKALLSCSILVMR